MDSKKTAENSKILIEQILINSREKAIQSGIIEMRISDHELIDLSRKRHF